MKRIALILAVLLLAAGCTSIPWKLPNGNTLHWKRTESVVTINVVVDPSANALKTMTGTIMNRWNQANLIHFRFAPNNVCAAGAACVFLKGKPMNGGSAGPSFTSDGHVVAGFITIDNTVPIDNQRDDVLCHEFGHIVPLAHGDEPGPCQGGWPTGDDLYNADYIHRHRHTT